MTPLQPAADVVAAPWLKDDFFKRHRKDWQRAEDAWRGLLERRGRLLEDTHWGVHIQRHLWPARFADRSNLWLVPELPHRFRALYTVLRHPVVGAVVVIEWIGDHAEYDALFGYATS